MTLYRVVNPALNPPQVMFGSSDEESAMREFAALDAGTGAFKLIKSEDEGKEWTEVEPRKPAPEPAPPEKKHAGKSHDETKHAK